MIRVLMALVLMALSASAWSHAASKSWLTLQVNDAHVEGVLAASIVDVALALRLDIREPAPTLRQHIAARREEAIAYVSRGLVLLANGHREALTVASSGDGTHGGEATIEFSVQAMASGRIDTLDIGYTLFFEDDVLHEALAHVDWEGGTSSNAVFRLGEPLQRFTRGAAATTGFAQFVRSGVWHIWTGYDHVLFLLVLLLPAVLLRAAGGWQPAPTLSPTLWHAAAIVTAFTVAHSVTLASAALGWIAVPARLVESAIALSVFIAAASNFFPAAAATAGTWMAFGFGLLHGLGFAGVLGELMSNRSDVWRPLLAFNLGVELGQLAIVALVLPTAWLMRGALFYRLVILRGGSAAICACAVCWFIARAFAA